MAFHETWTRYNAASTEMEYGYMTADPRELNDWHAIQRADGVLGSARSP